MTHPYHSGRRTGGAANRWPRKRAYHSACFPPIKQEGTLKAWGVSLGVEKFILTVKARADDKFILTSAGARKHVSR